MSQEPTKKQPTDEGLSVYDFLLKAEIDIPVEGTNDYVISCLNPEHADENPSLRINKESGLFHCFSCGYKGNLERLLEILEIEITPEDKERIRYKKLYHRLEKLNKGEVISQKEVKEIGGTPISENYRGVSKLLLSELGIVRNSYIGRLIIPIFLYNELRGYTMRALYGQEPKWNHSEGIEFDYLVYPFDYVSRNYRTTLFITEGPFDALRLLSLGYSAICMFGSETWNDHKLQLLLELSPRNVVVLLDNDEAGYRGRSKVARSVSVFFDTYIAKNLNKIGFTDPGETTQEQMKRLELVRWK